MQEQLISLETAKLAKEKSFDEACSWIYYDPPKIRKDLGVHPLTKDPYKIKLDYSSDGPRKYNFYKNTPKDNIERYHACSQSLLQKWLREVHKINVEANWLPNLQKYRCLYKPMNIRPKDFDSFGAYNMIMNNYVGMEDFPTYEEALEVGLQEALKLI